MSNQKICYVVFVRHGHTEYTDIFPDITDEGKRSLIQTAAQIATFASDRRIKFYSSPKPRAQGSASCLAKSLGSKRADAILVQSITACEQRQPERVMELVAKYLSSTNHLAVEEAYWTEPAFDDPKIIEPRAEIKKRFYVFLDRLVCIGLCRVNSPSCYICVSHAEVIGHIMQDVQAVCEADINPVVPYAQPVFLTFSQENTDQPILMDYSFDGHEATALNFDQIKPKPTPCLEA